VSEKTCIALILTTWYSYSVSFYLWLLVVTRDALVFSQRKSKSEREEPRLSYLRSTSAVALIHHNGSRGARGGNNGSSYASQGPAIIIKTLIISAVSCLASILFLMLVGYSVYHVAKMRSFLVHWPPRLRNQVSTSISKCTK